ncbi:uncharacterized protein V3H82_027571 isoform 4-T4 [Fundulus diaphanus]
MKVEAHYEIEGVPANRTIIFIILGAVIGVLLLLVVLAAVFIKLRKTRVKEDQRTTTEDQDSAPESRHDGEKETNLTYATVDHFNPKTSKKIKVKQDDDIVTYSAIRTKNRTEANIDPSSLYSSIAKTK